VLLARMKRNLDGAGNVADLSPDKPDCFLSS